LIITISIGESTPGLSASKTNVALLAGCGEQLGIKRFLVEARWDEVEILY